MNKKTLFLIITLYCAIGLMLGAYFVYDSNRNMGLLMILGAVISLFSYFALSAYFQQSSHDEDDPQGM